jgi:hypothetical protein
VTPAADKNARTDELAVHFRTREKKRAGVLAALAEHPDGLPTVAVAKRVRRRRADVLAALGVAERAGLVERLPPAGQAHARRWRLRAVETAPGTAREQRQTAGNAQADSQPIPTLAAHRRLPTCSHALGCRNPERHRGWRWQAPNGQELCALCSPPAISTALRATPTHVESEAA